MAKFTTWAPLGRRKRRRCATRGTLGRSGQYGFTAAAGRNSDLAGPAALARLEAHLGVLSLTYEETIAAALGIGRTAHLSGAQVDRLLERAKEYMATAVHAQQEISFRSHQGAAGCA